jgi:hypothetical protein
MALNCPVSAPVAVVQRVYVDAHGRIVYAGWTVYRGDRFLVERELNELVQSDAAYPPPVADLPQKKGSVSARVPKASAV